MMIQITVKMNIIKQLRIALNYIPAHVIRSKLVLERVPRVH